MGNRAKIDALNAERNSKIRAIEDEYNPQIEALTHKFTLEELSNNGWERYSTYLPGGREWLYKKTNSEGTTNCIRVGMDNHYILTYGGHPMRSICDLDDLEEYSKIGK